MEWLESFASWAWERHHNPWSWYIRPLFIIPFCYFAYRRSILGMVLTVFALMTSMFWFPKPDAVDPQAEAFLRAERDDLLGEWPWWKIAIALTIPLWFVTLAAAFWHRSLIWGAVAINAAVLGKVAWSFYFGEDSAWTLVPPALIGLFLCNAAVYLLYRYLKSNASLPAQ